MNHLARNEEGDEQNPMINHVVVGRLFELMPFNWRDFKNLRLVSKTWWKASLEKVRKNVWLCVKDKPKKAESPRSSLLTYMDWMALPGDPCQLLGNHKFKKYRVEDLQFELTGKSLERRTKRKFWNQVGATMTHLQLSHSVFCNNDELRRLLFELTPNLTYLSLKFNKYTDPALEENHNFSTFPTNWEEMFRARASQNQQNLAEFEVILGWIPHGWCDTEFPLCWMEPIVHFSNLQVLKLQMPTTACCRSAQKVYGDLAAFRTFLEVVRRNIVERLAQGRRLNFYENGFNPGADEQPVVNEAWYQLMPMWLKNILVR